MNQYDVFTLKLEHIILLTNSNVTWENWEIGAPSIDGKRPYGNSNVPYDIAKLVSYPIPRDEHDDVYFSDDDFMYLYQLHYETEYALDIILQTKSFVPGVYVSKHIHHKWQLTDKDSLPPGIIIDLNEEMKKILSQNYGKAKLSLINALEQHGLDPAKLRHLDKMVLEKMLTRRREQEKNMEDKAIDRLIHDALVSN